MNQWTSEYGDTGWTVLTGENLSTRRKPFQMPLRPSHILCGLACDWTRASSLRGRRISTWAVALHVDNLNLKNDADWINCWGQRPVTSSLLLTRLRKLTVSYNSSDGWIGVQIPAGARDFFFFLRNVQTGSGATQSHIQYIADILPGGGVSGAWSLPLTRM